MKPSRKPAAGQKERRAWTLTLGGSVVLWVAVSLLLPGFRYLSWLIATGAITLVAFALDKHRARNAAWRLPERVLLTLMGIGGVFGAWVGMQGLRHKTRKPLFRHVLWASTALHLVLLLARYAR